MSQGATPAGTNAYRARFASRLPGSHFRRLVDWTVSSIGLGTYLGAEDDETDRAYAEAIVDAARLGCNLFDTAINYRAQRSERTLGAALAALCRDGHARDEFVVCTKGGYVPFDGFVPPSPAAFFHDTYVRAGIVALRDLVAGCHVIAPRYLADQLARSLSNLGLARVDVYYLHNPETQLAAVPRDEFLARVRAAFRQLETEVDAGRIGCYGVATWDGLRRRPGDREHLALTDLVRAAEDVAGGAHRFAVIQLPYNLAMAEAYAEPTQLVDGQAMPPLDAARALGLATVASASLHQGQLSVRLPQAMAEAFPGLRTPAQRALQFVRSTPGITSALVGMSRRTHVAENLAVSALPSAPAGVDSVVERR